MPAGGRYEGRYTAGRCAVHLGAVLQGRQSHSRLNQGTGWGWPLPNVLELHGATVEVSSQVGQGAAVFSMYFSR